MIRKALIISNPGETSASNYCTGVNVDVINYVGFLTSPLGGSWTNSEIVHLSRPSRSETRSQIRSIALSADYSFIVFTGHGYYSCKSNSTILELRKDEEIDSVELRASATKRTIILDCCRVVQPEVVKESLLKAAVEIAPQLNAAKCRKYFENKIEECGNGIVVGHACSRGETAGDGGSNGGYYSSSIMQSAKQWHETTQVNIDREVYTLNIVTAHEAAISSVRKLSGGTQNPDIEKPRSLPYFPFAIMA